MERCTKNNIHSDPIKDIAALRKIEMDDVSVDGHDLGERNSTSAAHILRRSGVYHEKPPPFGAISTASMR